MRRHVYFYTYLDPGFAVAAPVLLGEAERWLPAPATPHEDAWRVRLSAKGVLPVQLAERDAAVQVGESTTTEQRVVRPVLWRALEREGLFPVLEADLELAGLNGSGCQLTFVGSYRPPLSVVGDAGDRLVGHRIAEACVRRFVLDVAARLA